jgi:Mrp family chromosome partitioning ATPase
MSKILKAMRKAPGAVADFGARLQSVDTVRLFPLPHPAQMPEFAQLVNSLIGLHDGRGGLVIVFSSASRGEGTSYVSYNVARQLTVMLDRKIAWVDANFESPQTRLEHETLNFRNLLLAPELWREFPVSDSLTLVPNGSQAIKPTDLLRSVNYVRLLESFANTFSFTVIDAPPFLESVDVGHLAARATGLVVVIESRGLKHEVIRHGLEQVKSLDVDVLGAVLNRRVFDIPRAIYKRL